MHSIIKEGKVVNYSKKTIALVIEKLKDLRKSMPNKNFHILECGSGGGNATKDLLEVMGKEDKIDCIEISANLAKADKEKFSHDKRVTVHNIDICEFSPSVKFDFVLNMVPSNAISVPLDKVWEKVLSLCHDHGRIVTLPYCGNMTKIIEKINHNHTVVRRWNRYQEIIKNHLYSKEVNLQNIPPCYVIVLEKKNSF